MIIIIITTYYLTLAFIDDVALPTLAILFIHYFLTSPNQHLLLLHPLHSLSGPNYPVVFLKLKPLDRLTTSRLFLSTYIKRYGQALDPSHMDGFRQ